MREIRQRDGEDETTGPDTRSRPSAVGAAALSEAAAETLGSWREMFDRRTAGANVGAGIAVAMVAVPLNLALAVACELPPSAGLVSGAIAGAIGALFGGSRLSVTGPEVALAPLTAVIVAAHGVDGMLVATALAGAIQVGLGLFGVGGLVRLLPRPVVGGFLAAVGVMVFDAQLPHFVGVHDGRSALAIAGGLSGELASHGTAIAMGALVVVLFVATPRLVPRAPAPLVALAAAVAATALLGLPLERVDPVHGDALQLRIPEVAGIEWRALLPSALGLAVLASVDSLLCAASIDARVGGRPHRADQELVAQGVANVACALAGGMPVAGAIVRSAAAIEARASTRLCALVQSGVLLAVLVVIGPHLDVVPLAALAGVLLVVGAKLIDLRELARLARVRRFDALIFVVTAAGIVVVGFVEGLALGVALAIVELTSAHGSTLELSLRVDGERHVVRLRGPLVFASQSRAARLLELVTDRARVLVVELAGVTHWDASGLAALRSALRAARDRGARTEVVAGAIPIAALETELAGTADLRAARASAPPPARISLEPWALERAE